MKKMFVAVVVASSMLLASCAGEDRTRDVDEGTVAAVAATPATPATPASSGAGATADAAAPPPQPRPRRVVLQGVDLTGVGYDRGRADAPIVLVEFSDFGCPFCGSHARQTFPALDREYIAPGKVFYKYVPFVMGMFPNGRQAARTAECAAEQGKFWAMHDTLYARQREWKQTLSPMGMLGGYARGMRLDSARFHACYMANEPFHPRTRAANERAEELGVRVTPSFVVNGRAVEGALPLPQFRALLDDLGRR